MYTILLYALAVVALATTAPRTYDIATHQAPPGAELLIGLSTVVLLDLGYIILDLVMSRLPTRRQRYIILGMMFLWWAAIGVTVISDAVLRQTLTDSPVMYIVSAVALAYLGGFALVRFLDPATARRLQDQDARQVMYDEISTARMATARSLAPAAGAVVSTKDIEEMFRDLTGLQIADVAGADWVRKSRTGKVQITDAVALGTAPGAPGRPAAPPGSLAAPEVPSFPLPVGPSPNGRH